MKKMNTMFKIGGLCLAAVLLVLTGCFSPFDPPGNVIPPGMGAVTLNIAGTSARTLLPDAIFDPAEQNKFAYTYQFTRQGESTVSGTVGAGSIILKTGAWNLYLEAKYNNSLIGTARMQCTIVQGSNTIKVLIVPWAGDTDNPVVAKGTLAWELYIPAGTDDAKLYNRSYSCRQRVAVVCKLLF